IGLRVTECARTHIGDPDIGLATVALERPQDGVVRRLTPDEAVGRVDVAAALDPHDPVARPRQEDHLARLPVVTAPGVLDLALPAQISRPNHDDARRGSPRGWLAPFNHPGSPARSGSHRPSDRTDGSGWCAPGRRAGTPGGRP